MRRYLAVLVSLAVVLGVSACTESGAASDEDDAVVMPCSDDATVATSPVIVPADQATGLDEATVNQAIDLLMNSPEYGPCLRTGRASVAQMIPFSSGTGKKLGVSATLTFTEPVDLPRTVQGWGAKTENDPLPEDDLGRPIVGPLPDEVRAQTTVVLVMITLVGDPGVWASAKLQ